LRTISVLVIKEQKFRDQLLNMSFVWLEVFTALWMKTAVFWNMKLC